MTTFVLATPGRNAACDGFVDAVDGGTGTATLVVQNTASTTLISFDLPDPAFGGAATGVASLASSVTGVSPAAGGNPSQFLLKNKSGTTLATGDAGASGATFTISATLATSDSVDLTAFTVTVPAS